MGWFNKKEEEGNSNENIPELPRLPSLRSKSNFLKPPRLPSELELEDYPTQLPSLPTGSMGDKFSQNAIKDAVISPPRLPDDQRGEEEGEEGFEEESPRIPQLPKKKFTKEISESYEMPTPMTRSTVKAEPMFVRLDKFEESVQIIEKTKKELAEIEEMLKDIKKIKDEEQREIQYWENTLQKIKQEIDKVDKEIFSKI